MLTKKPTGFKSLNNFWKKLVKRSKGRKREHHYKTLHNETSLGTKIRLKLTFLNFWIKLTKKGYFRTKKKKKITIEFYIFKSI